MNESELENELIDGMTVEQIRDRLQTPNRCWSDSYCDCAQQHAADRLLEHYDALAARLADQDMLLKAYDVLRRAVNESTNECGPDCDDHGHADDCPALSPSSWLEAQQREIDALKVRLAEADALIAKGLAVVHDFLPNIGRCVLQDYQRMNEFCSEAAARTAVSASGGANG